MCQLALRVTDHAIYIYIYIYIYIIESALYNHVTLIRAQNNSITLHNAHIFVCFLLRPYQQDSDYIERRTDPGSHSPVIALFSRVVTHPSTNRGRRALTSVNVLENPCTNIPFQNVCLLAWVCRLRFALQFFYKLLVSALRQKPRTRSDHYSRQQCLVHRGSFNRQLLSGYQP